VSHCCYHILYYILLCIHCRCHYAIIIIHAFITCANSVMILNQRRWQSLGGQHGKRVDGLFKKVSFQMAFEGVETG